MSTSNTIRRQRIDAHGKRIPFISRWQRRDTLAIAINGAAKLTPNEIAKTLAPMKEAMVAMREGRGQRRDFEWLCTACHIGQAVEDGGVVRGFETLIDRAYSALNSIEQRAMPSGDEADWQPVILYTPEINALADWVSYFGGQIGHLSWREYTDAYNKAIARVTSNGGKSLDPKHLH